MCPLPRVFYKCPQTSGIGEEYVVSRLITD